MCYGREKMCQDFREGKIVELKSQEGVHEGSGSGAEP